MPLLSTFNTFSTREWNGRRKINDEGFVFTIETQSGNNEFTIFCGQFGNNINVYWGDGTTSTNISNIETHTYANGGRYDITVTGNIDIKFSPNANTANNANCVRDVKSWGSNTDVIFISGNLMFANCNNITTFSALDSPKFGSNANLSFMFLQATNFNSDISDWNTSNVIAMDNMFTVAKSFNQPIGNWITNNVSNMDSMFSSASSFNQPIGNWNTSKVTDMAGMFSGANSFNQPIGNWNTSNVTDMNGMFNSASSFNQPINTWNTSKVTNMAGMFRFATSYNQPLFSWKTGNVINMQLMFENATIFNQNLSQWCVTNITTKPFSFDTNANAWILPRPVWGTCPNP